MLTLRQIRRTPGLRFVSGASKVPNGKTLRRGAYRSIEILAAVIAGNCWWGDIKRNLSYKLDNMGLGTLLCRLVIRGLLIRKKARRGGRVQWQYFYAPEARPIADPGYDKIMGATGSVSDCAGDDYPDQSELN